MHLGKAWQSFLVSPRTNAAQIRGLFATHIAASRELESDVSARFNELLIIDHHSILSRSGFAEKHVCVRIGVRSPPHLSGMRDGRNVPAINRQNCRNLTCSSDLIPVQTRGLLAFLHRNLPSWRTEHEREEDPDDHG